jgi:outer membrane lipoprotein carrier protein
MFSFPLFLSLLIAIPAQAKSAPTPDQVVGSVQKFYEGAASYAAVFRQTVILKSFPTRTADGRVYIKVPGKMRWDYYGKPTRNHDRRVAKSFISDGETLWAVMVDDKQVIVKDVKSDLLPVAISFLTGKGDLRRDFDPVFNRQVTETFSLGDKGDIVLQLTPKAENSLYKSLYLVVDPTNYRVKQSLVLNANGDINWFQFYTPKIGAPIKKEIFTFSEKNHPDYKVIDASKLPKKG